MNVMVMVLTNVMLTMNFMIMGYDKCDVNDE